MTLNAPGTCCFKGVKHEGQPRGCIESVGETEAYVSEPTSAVASNGYGILYLTDIIGHQFVNAQLLADAYAENGYVVLMPDLFHDDPVPLNADMATFSIPTWMQGGLWREENSHIPQTVDPIVDACINTLQQKYDCKGVTHGFVVRADLKVRVQRYAKESALFEALQWLEEHLREE
ncbi:hypothetical protein OIDMADRAFT_27722 [Oidiodendron maius Zn]|uniref:Dienelactone hydrolase domain-containing protein n=1 Tax=Oidiodendron maius (strain Zn) TaxID=913774 RepID=A0A0C3HJN1_OIDMZ|nr:hypothetical protein OIDMADRAFT_27722 [Oidiodendron maius Zn]